MEDFLDKSFNKENFLEMSLNMDNFNRVLEYGGLS